MPFEKRIYKFNVEVRALLDNGEDIDLSKNVKELRVKKSYTTQSLPLYQIHLLLDEVQYKQMSNNDADIHIRSYNITSEENSEDEVLGDMSIDTVIRSYSKNYMDVYIRKEDNDEDSSINNLPFIIVGTPERLLDINSKVLNAIYHDASLTDVLVNILSDINIDNKTIDVLSNEKIYRNIVIPPSSLIPAIKGLNNMYGLYDSSIGVFLDTENVYVFKIGNHDRNHRNILTYNVIDNYDDNKDTATLRIDEENNIEMSGMQLEYSDDYKVIDHSTGSNTVFHSYDFNYNTFKRYTNKDIDDIKFRYFWNSAGDEIFEKQIINSLELNKGVTSLRISNIDPKLLDINTLVNIKGNGTAEYSYGSYHINELISVFSTKDYNTYISTTILSLGRTR